MARYGDKRACWDWQRCEDEFEGFTAWHRREGTTAACWFSAWQGWVIRGAGFDRKERSARAIGPTAVVDRMLAHAAEVDRRGGFQ
jgi:hypothetical protein